LDLADPSIQRLARDPTRDAIPNGVVKRVTDIDRPLDAHLPVIFSRSFAARP